MAEPAKIEPTSDELNDQKHTIEVDANNLVRYWQERDAIMLLDRDIINLVKPEATTGEIRWFTNEPKVFFGTAQSLISLNPPRFRFPMTMEFDVAEKKRMNKAERLSIGIQRLLDKRQVDTGGTYWLRDLAYWVLLGWYAVFDWVTKENGETKFIADIWDPITVYPQWDTNGLIKCVRTYEVDKITAISMARDFLKEGLKFDFVEPSTEDARPKVINYWRKTMNRNKPVIENAILIAGQVIKPLTVQTKLDRIPIHVGSVGSPDRTVPNWIQRRGEPIFAGSRDMYKYQNAIFSLRATILAATAYHNIVSKTLSGRGVLKGEPVKGYGQEIPIKVGEAVDILKHAATPEDADVLLGFINSQLRKDSFPDVVYGNLPVETSGFGISQLMAAIKYKGGPYLSALQSITSNVHSDLLYQYKRGNFPPITLSTLNPESLKRGMTFIEEFTPDDVPEHIYVEVTIPITSQFDKTQAILNAVQAKNSQLMSRETLWEEDLDIQDTEQERERIRQDLVDQDPFVLEIEIIEGLYDKVAKLRLDGKNAEADALKRYIMMKEQNVGINQGMPVAGGAPGIPPNQMPAEARESPDQLNAMLGKGPSGLNRRPQTAEERAASKGRKGRLVSPSGEVLL